MATKKTSSTHQAWDNGELGRDEAFVARADEAQERALDDTLGMQVISIRLPKQLIDQYKLIAHFHGVGYQPLMRDVLQRFVPSALREILESQSRAADDAAAKASAAQKAA